MNKKAEQEYKQLIKLGVTESMARLIVMKKYHSESDETFFLLQEEQEEQNELKNAIEQFSFQPFISNNNVYDKDKNTTI